MPEYVDGFLIPLPKKNVAAYRTLARKAAKVWLEHGALAYRECVGDDLDVQGMTNSFPKVLKCKEDEVPIFAWVTYKSRKDRDRIVAKVMADPRLANMCGPDGMLFNLKRMCYAGFQTLVDL